MKRGYLLILALVMIVSLCACSTGTADVDKTSSSEVSASESSVTDTAEMAENTTGEVKYTIALITESLANEYWVTLSEGMQVAADELGVELIVKDGQGDAATQVSYIEDLMTMGVDAIAMFAIDATAVEPYLIEAEAAGITIVAIGNHLEGDSGLYTGDQHEIGYNMGEIAGQWILDNLESDTDAYVLTLTDQTVQNMVNREEGIMDGLLSLAPNANIVDRLDANDTETALTVTENVLTRSPELNVVIGKNDTVSLGAYQAMDADGKKPGEACVVGCDSGKDALSLIKKDTIYVGTIDISPYQAGQNFIPYIIAAIEEGPQDVMLDPITKVTIDNIDDYVE